MTNKIAYTDGEIGEVTAAGRSKNRGSKKNPGFIRSRPPPFAWLKNHDQTKNSQKRARQTEMVA